MNLKIDRDQDKCLECMFLDDPLFDYAGKCLLFNQPLKGETNYGQIEHWIPCNECNLVWRNGND